MILQISAFVLLLCPAAFTFRLRQSEATDCVCPSVYAPLCASSGVTYPNECSYLCAKEENPELSILSQGPCPTDIDSNVVDDHLAMESRLRRIDSSQTGREKCICSFDYKPVCGSNHQTYPNICWLNCERENTPGLEIASYGECTTKPNALPSRPIRPTPYRRTRTVSGGRMKQASTFGDDESCACTKEFRPICASDGMTYSNPCLQRCAQKRDSAIKFVSEGPCEL